MAYQQWDSAELIYRVLKGERLSRRQKACLCQHLQRVVGRLSDDEAAAAETLGLHMEGA